MTVTPHSPLFSSETIADVVSRMARFSFQFGLPAALHSIHADGTATDFSLTFTQPVTAPLHADGFLAGIRDSAQELADRLADARASLAETGEPAVVHLERSGREMWPVLTITAARYYTVQVEEEDDVDIW